MPIDLRFNFKRNPYSATQTDISTRQSDMFNTLMNYINEHSDKFISFDPITGIRYTQLESPSVLCGVSNPSKCTNMNDFRFISSRIKKFISSMQMDLTPELAEWVGASNTTDNDTNDEATEGESNSITVPSDIQLTKVSTSSTMPNTIINDLPAATLSSISIGYNYDSTTDKRLNYDEVCALCINIARLNNNNKNTKDPSIKAIEDKRKRDLINEIERYRKNKTIAMVCGQADLTNMNIEQLETNLSQCKEKHNTLKLKEVSRNGLNILGDAYDAIFPLGIPIGKGRHLQFNGVGDEIINQLHNPTTAVGLSYDNFINKHNIHISDELSIVAAIATIFLKNIHITKKNDTDEAAEDDDNGDNEEDAEEDVEDDYEEDLKDID